MEENQDQTSQLACQLREPEQIQQRRTAIKELREAAQEVQELANGYALRFPGDGAWLMRLLDFVAFERACCPFLSLGLDFEAHAGPIWLRVQGPEGVKEFIRSEVAAITITPGVTQ